MIEPMFDCKAAQLEFLGVADRLDIHDRSGQACEALRGVNRMASELGRRSGGCDWLLSGRSRRIYANTSLRYRMAWNTITSVKCSPSSCQA
jgi:hypothetical protein